MGYSFKRIIGLSLKTSYNNIYPWEKFGIDLWLPALEFPYPADYSHVCCLITFRLANSIKPKVINFGLVLPTKANTSENRL